MLYIVILIAIVFGIWFLVTSIGGRLSKTEADAARAPPKVLLGDTASVRSIRGSRAHMEDTYAAAVGVGGDERRAFFAVYDGHGGHRASDYAAEHLHNLVLNNALHRFDEEPVLALEAAFRQLDQSWLTLATRNNWDDGTTAIVSLIVDGTLYVANVGDSRAVLSNSGKAVDMSHDHKPIREDEKQRIEKLGGRIIHYGTWRVEGVLAVTRAIGDRRLKKYISAVPEIKARALKDGDDRLILASDGVWDVLSSQAAVDIVCQCKDVHEAARRLTDTAYKRGSMDNITSLVVDLRKYRASAAAAAAAGGAAGGHNAHMHSHAAGGAGAQNNSAGSAQNQTAGGGGVNHIGSAPGAIGIATGPSSQLNSGSDVKTRANQLVNGLTSGVVSTGSSGGNHASSASSSSALDKLSSAMSLSSLGLSSAHDRDSSSGGGGGGSSRERERERERDRGDREPLLSGSNNGSSLVDRHSGKSKSIS